MYVSTEECNGTKIKVPVVLPCELQTSAVKKFNEHHIRPVPQNNIKCA